MEPCRRCGTETNLYVDGEPICARCDQQAQVVARLRRLLDEIEARKARERERAS
jgi:hypothetical protein